MLKTLRKLRINGNFIFLIKAIILTRVQWTATTKMCKQWPKQTLFLSYLIISLWTVLVWGTDDPLHVIIQVSKFLLSYSCSIPQGCHCLWWKLGGCHNQVPAVKRHHKGGMASVLSPRPRTTHIVFFFNLFYLFLAALGLRCCAWAFSNCGKWGLLFVAVCMLLIVVASLVAEHGL